MISLIISISFALVCSIFSTRFLIRFLTKHEMGQFIRQDGPQSHLTKRGTPTMGGLAIIFSTIVGYSAAALWMWISSGRIPKISSLLIIGIMLSFGAIGFLDDYIKIKQKQSEGLTPAAKLILQIIVGGGFGIANLLLNGGNVPAFTILNSVSIDLNLYFNGTFVFIAILLFLIIVNLIIVAWSNAVNLTDGLDGLATGVSIFAFAPYILICFWQFTHSCVLGENEIDNFCYSVRDPWDLVLISASITGACFGFLWWNTNPAKIFMGDTGSLALGSAFASISILSHTEVLAIIIGGMFVLECVSDVVQVGYFRLSGKMGWKRRRVFKMAPLHHHFEMLKWKEINVVVRFWMISALCAAFGLGIFYANWLQSIIF